ncbi:hypothetical protein [Nonomuraea helvata]|uniref:Uncharacterized protein n=1 Tax=Nonomuraea helvata TaxID=37484 RepID=A0ABV5SFW7_9ACTN
MTSTTLGRVPSGRMARRLRMAATAALLLTAAPVLQSRYETRVAPAPRREVVVAC